MKWTPGGDSRNIEDRRGQAGGGGGFRGGGLRLGLGGTIVVLVLSLIFRQDLFRLFDTGAATGGASAGEAPVGSTPEESTLVEFVKFVLNDAQSMWTAVLPRMGVDYQDATLVLFRDATQSVCGYAETASGPFYCPGDQKVYIDLGFYQELKDRFGAPGDFAQAYVLAHEIGHHVQKLLGTEEQVRRAQRTRPTQENDLSVRMELQADCYAGIWAFAAERAQLLEIGDIDEGLNAAAAVGDDRLQRMSTGHVNPDTFTHGSSAERVAWFRRGYSTGRPDACDTFSSR